MKTRLNSSVSRVLDKDRKSPLPIPLSHVKKIPLESR